MTWRHRTPSAPPVPSRSRRSRRAIHENDLDDDHSTIPVNYNDCQDENLESDDEPLQLQSGITMGKQPWNDSCTSTLGRQVEATKFTPASAQPLHTECREVYTVSEEEDAHDPAPLASKIVSDQVFECFNPPANVYIDYNKDPNEAGEQLVEWTAGNLWWYEPFVDDMQGLMVSEGYKAQTTISAIPVMVMACVKPIAINYVMFVNLLAKNAVKTPQIHSWWYEEIARIDPAQRNSDPVRAYISVVNESSQPSFWSLTLCIRLLQRLLAPMQQWCTSARLQSTLFMYLEHSSLQKSG